MNGQMGFVPYQDNNMGNLMTMALLLKGIGSGKKPSNEEPKPESAKLEPRQSNVNTMMNVLGKGGLL